MLSFLQQQNNDSAVSDGEQQQSELLTVASKSSQVRKTTMMFTVLFVLGLLALLFMIRKTTPQIALALSIETDHSRIDTAIAQLGGIGLEMSEGMRKLVNKFNQSDKVRQVEITQLMKNPFKTERFFGDLSDLRQLGEFANSNGAQLRQQAMNMQLLSIMRSGGKWCCMIDEQILYVGDLVGGFKVTKIDDSSVVLVMDETEIVLKLIVD